MTRLKGKILNVEEHDGVTKEGKSYFWVSALVLDQDNEVAVVRCFDREGTLKRDCKKLFVVSSDCEFMIDKLERLPNRTFDAQGQIVRKL